MPVSSDDADEYTVIASAKRTGASTSRNGVEHIKDAAKRLKSSGNGSSRMAPIFQRAKGGGVSESAGEGSGSRLGANVVWKKPLGTDQTCLRGEVGEPFARAIAEQREANANAKPLRVACFDLDGCLVKPKSGNTWPSATDAYDFEQAFRGTFARVKKEYNGGACIVIVTNQDQSRRKTGDNKRLTTWKQKMRHIAEAIDCPFVVFAALSRDGFRKPGRLIWDQGVVASYAEAGGKACDLNPSHAFFVGDAAGRVGDHSDTDRKWAINLDMPFYTPEEFFLDHKPKPFKLSGWKPSLDVPVDDRGFLPSTFFPKDSAGKLDLVLFVGPPASGKTSFFREHFAHRDYEHINQDTLKTAARCLTKARDTLEAGRSVVIDNTNRNASTRAPYIRLAKSMADTVQVRCVYFSASQELCAHNNFFRVRAGLQRADEPRQLLPGIAFTSFFSNVEVPTREEGFDADVVSVHWQFQGDEESKRRWLMQWD